MMRQKLALVVIAPPSLALRRMNGFSPVRITWFGSAAMTHLFVCPQPILARSRGGTIRICLARAGVCGLRAWRVAVMLRPAFAAAKEETRADEHRIVDLEHAERPQDHGRAGGDGPAL